jgi:putative ABC transport system permease protein
MRDWKRYVRERLPLPETKGASDESVVEELAGELEDLYLEALERGASEGEAEAYALEGIGDWDSLAEEVVRGGEVRTVSGGARWLERAEVRGRAWGGGWAWLADLERDTRFSLRALRKSPGFTLVALLTLALGIGSVTTLFSLINGVLLKPLPYAESGELVYMWEKLASFENATVTYPNFLDWRERNRVFEDLAAFNGGSINLTGVGDPVELDVVRVSASMFPILRALPLTGRTFLPEEDKLGGERVVVLSYGFWQERFGGDPGILGRALTLDGNPFTVIGVMPRDFEFPVRGDLERIDVFVAIERFAENWIDNRGNHPGIAVIGRLAPGATLERARGDMERVALELEAEYPDSNEGSRVHVASLHERMTRNLREPMMLLLLAVGLLLLIACTNVANLVLARVTVRQREIAIRTGLGANGPRIVRLLLTESLTLWVLGGLLGIAFAHGATRALLALRGDQLAPVFEVGIDARVVAVTLAVALLTGLLFGLAPALRSLRLDLVEHLKEGARSSGGVGRNRLRSALVVAEVSLAVALLVAAGLTVRSFAEMMRASPGFDPENVLSVEINLPAARYPEVAQRTAFFHELLDRVRAIPGVRSAATSYVLPMAPGGWQNAFHVEGEPPEEAGVYTFAEVSSVSADYFATMGIPLLRGREFRRSDAVDAPPVVIVDEMLAARHWPNDDPIGKRLKSGDYTSESPWIEVVGVVGHVKVNGVVQEALPQCYVPHWQDNDDAYFLAVKSAGDPIRLIEPVRQAVLAIDPAQPIAEVNTMTAYVRATTADGRFMATLLGTFAAAALLLAAVGIYGVMAQATAERGHEIGVRVALGATAGEVLAMVVRQGMGRVVLGVVLGLALAVAIGRLLAGSLFGVSALDPATFLAAPFFLSLVALAASLIAARRAVRVDPMRALYLST